MAQAEGWEKQYSYKVGKKKVYMPCGVCAGIAEYLGIDPTLVRLAWVLFCALGGSGVLAYILSAIIIPPENRV